MPDGQRGSDSVYTEPFPACTNTEGVWGDKGQAGRLQQSPTGSGPARSGLGVAGNGQSWGGVGGVAGVGTESGRLPAVRTQAGCPASGASCPWLGKNFEEYRLITIPKGQAGISVFLSLLVPYNPFLDKNLDKNYKNIHNKINQKSKHR